MWYNISMQQSQKFSIASSGVVRGGDCQYTADLVTGAVSYDAEIKLPFWQTKSASGTYQANPEDFLSNVFQKVGDYISIGGVVFTAVSIEQGETDVTFAVTGSNVTGNAKFDTTGQYLKILSLYAQGSALGMSFNIAATPE